MRLLLAAALLLGALAAGPDAAWAQATTSTTPTSDPTATAAGGAASNAAGDPGADEAEAERLRAEAEKLERLQAEQDSQGAAEEDVSLWPTFVRTVVMLSVVCLLAYLLLGKLMPKLLRIEPPAAQRRLMKVIDRLPIDQKRSIMIVQLGADFFMIGAAEQNISLMSKLDAEDVERLLAEPDPGSPGLGRLSDLFARRQAKGS